MQLETSGWVHSSLQLTKQSVFNHTGRSTPNLVNGLISWKLGNWSWDQVRGGLELVGAVPGSRFGVGRARVGWKLGGEIGGDSFENKSRVGFSEIIQSYRVHVGPKSSSRVFSSHREGFRAQNKGQQIFPRGFFRVPLGGWHHQIDCKAASF